MANDLAAMKARIASELARADLTAQIASAINDAIAVYQKERFRFSDIVPNAPPTFNTVAGRYIYTSADNANINTAFNIDYVFALIGTTLSALYPMSPASLKLLNNGLAITGQPTEWAYEGNQLLISPVPDQAYTVTLGIFRRVAAPADDTEANNPWMTDGERLIRARAKFEIATHVTRNATMAAAMSPDPPASGQIAGAAYREWKSLKSEANRITALGRVRAMQF